MTNKIRMALLLLGLAVGGFTVKIVFAKPEFMNSFNSKYPNSPLINNCAVCHTGTTPSENNLNPYGRDYDQHNNSFSAIEPLDSDSDGYSNLTEINAGTLPGDPTSNPGSLTSGAALYGTYCAGCHGPLATSTKIGRTATQIQNAINTVGAMSGLSSLTSTQIQAIASALGQQSPPPPTPPTTDGPTLYAQNCASCHGPLATSTKIGRTATQIQNAINTVGAMSGLSSLTSTQIQAIAAALAQQGPSNGSAPDMSIWVGKWFKITEKNSGYSYENTSITKGNASYTGYLKIWNWDPAGATLQADRYEQNEQTGEWFSYPQPLHFFAGTQSDFLCWAQETGDFTAGFIARIQESAKNGKAGKATIKSLGGYFISSTAQAGSSRLDVGGLTITGTMVSEPDVPVPSSIWAH